ncbi:MAG: hypothetical protein QM802_20145 [Agriterribacter sp.]
MNIKNYTTEVPAVRSIAAIEQLLVGFGSTNIMKEYGPAGRVAAISFMVEMDGMKLPFQLPVKVQDCYVWLKKRKAKTNDKTLLEQAERIAWKQMHELIHIQLSHIELNQAEKLELFLPYLYDVSKRETYYQKVKSGGFKALLPG